MALEEIETREGSPEGRVGMQQDWKIMATQTWATLANNGRGRGIYHRKTNGEPTINQRAA